MIRAYDEWIDHIVGGARPGAGMPDEPSQEATSRVAELLDRAPQRIATPEQQVELDDYLQLEHLMRRVKARLRERQSAG